mmetsp:Transcript_27286/g.45490  ORF Transcript_27286/g.45490 Transcript_27286/m.45490 type:complete len:89 (+) Transcript_27286:97-363(+)
MFKKSSQPSGFPGARSGPASGPANVQRDWEHRDFTQSIQLGVTQLTAFLNEFDSTTRGKLAQLNGKLAQIERRMNLVEAILQSVDQEG